MISAGRSGRSVLGLWAAVAAVCAASTLGGYALATVAGSQVSGAINGLAAGALLVMLVDEMIPEARRKTGNWAGLVTVLGFALAAGLSQLT